MILNSVVHVGPGSEKASPAKLPATNPDGFWGNFVKRPGANPDKIGRLNLDPLTRSHVDSFGTRLTKSDFSLKRPGPPIRTEIVSQDIARFRVRTYFINLVISLGATCRTSEP
jgi:hypothetical protein